MNKVQKGYFPLWLIVFSSIVLLISQNSKYYFLQNGEIYLYFISFGVFAISGTHMIDAENKKISYVLFFLMVFFVSLFGIIHQERPFVTIIYEFIFSCIYLSLKYEYRFWIYNKFIKILSILFLLGIIEYILLYAGVNFFWGTYERENMEFYQSIFTSVPVYYSEVPARFMAFCEEPGLVGTLSFFILISLDKTKYRKEFYIFLISGILSLSMAFYLLGLLYFVLHFRKYFFSFKKLLAIAIVVVLAFTFLGDFLDYRIFGRVNSKDAIETLDNRNDDNVNKKFDNYIKTSDALLGIGHRTYYNWKKQTDSISVGLKEQLFMYGFVGVFMIFIIFSLIYLKYNGKNKERLKVLLLYWVSFYQRSYWFFPPLVIVLFNNRNIYENRNLNIS